MLRGRSDNHVAPGKCGRCLHYLRMVGQRREWLDYEGDCVHQELPGDWANMDEYGLGKPTGTNRAIALRAYDPVRDEWSFW